MLPGADDRLAAVLANIPGRTLPFTRLTLIDSEAVLPTGLRRLVSALRVCGVEIVETGVPTPASGDLGKVQSAPSLVARQSL